MEPILRDECTIIIQHEGRSPYVIERKEIQTDADVEPALNKLKREPWATEEVCQKIKLLLIEWLDATYRRGKYAPNPERDAAAAALLKKYSG